MPGDSRARRNTRHGRRRTITIENQCARRAVGLIDISANTATVMIVSNNSIWTTKACKINTIRARRYPVGIVDIVVDADVDVDNTRRSHVPNVVVPSRVRRSTYKKDSPR